MIDIKKGLKLIGLFAQEHAPEILTGIGIAGSFTAAIWAVKVTPKVVDELREKEPETFLDELKIAAPHYAGPVIVEVVSAICTFESLSTSKRRNAGLAALVSMYENDILDYKKAAKEIVGEKKANDIEDKVAENKAQIVPMKDEPHMIRTGTGQTLCLDLVTGQMFWSDIDWIRKKFLDLNEFIQQNDELDISDYAYIMSLEEPQLISHQLGWKYDPKRHSGEQIVLHQASTIRNGVPVFVIGHEIPPRYDYNKK